MSLAGYLVYRFPDGVQSGGQSRVLCPKCEHPNKKAFIHIDDGKAICFHCGWRAGGWRSLIRSIEEIESEAELNSWIEKHKESFGSGFSRSGSYASMKRVMRQEMPVEAEELCPGDEFCEYLESRGFSYLTAEIFGMRKCTSGKYRGRIIIPVYEDKELKYYFDRSVNSADDRKTLGVGSAFYQWPVKKSHVVFNLDMAREFVRRTQGKVYIAEGIFSALSLGTENVLATLGKGFSREQVRKILSVGANEYEICFDPDAKDSAHSLAKSLTDGCMDRDVRIYIREYSDGDPNDYYVKGTPHPEGVEYNPLFNLRSSIFSRLELCRS